MNMGLHRIREEGSVHGFGVKHDGHIDAWA